MTKKTDSEKYHASGKNTIIHMMTQTNPRKKHYEVEDGVKKEREDNKRIGRNAYWLAGSGWM